MKTVCRISNRRVPCVAFIGRLANRSLLFGSLFYPLFALGLITPAHAFEGRITAALTRGGETQTFTYTVGTSMLRIERNETDRPYPGNLVARETGTVTLLFPHNRSFVRLKPPVANTTPGSMPMTLPAGGLPPGIGPQSGLAVPGASIPPTSIGPTNLPGMPNLPKPQMPQVPHAPGLPAGMGAGIRGGMPAPPMMPVPEELLEMKATGEKAKVLGYDCARYEIKQRGEIMEIWATDTLLPFQPYLQKRHSRFHSRLMEECWGDLLKTQKLFPLRVTLKSDSGSERLQFEVKTIASEKIEDRDRSLFQTPADYHELEDSP